jgi:hypothetical protein
MLRLAATAIVPDVYVEHRARTCASPVTFCVHVPAAVAVLTSVRVVPTGITAAAIQLVPSSEASKVTVPEKVPVICHATPLEIAFTGIITQVVDEQMLAVCAVRFPPTAQEICGSSTCAEAGIPIRHIASKTANLIFVVKVFIVFSFGGACFSLPTRS